MAQPRGRTDQRFGCLRGFVKRTDKIVFCYPVREGRESEATGVTFYPEKQ